MRGLYQIVTVQTISIGENTVDVVVRLIAADRVLNSYLQLYKIIITPNSKHNYSQYVMQYTVITKSQTYPSMLFMHMH